MISHILLIISSLKFSLDCGERSLPRDISSEREFWSSRITRIIDMAQTPPPAFWR